MLRFALIGAGLALCGFPAAAQTTQCTPTIIGMPSAGVTCRTDGAAAQPAVNQSYSWRDVPPTPCSGYQKAFPDNHAMCAARDVAAHRKAVGDLIAAGKCDDALKGALGTGDLQFAREVRDFCGAR